MTSINFHTDNLAKLCRVCGNKLKREGKLFDVTDHKTNLQKAFWIDLSLDSNITHPNKFCDTCYHSMNNIVKKGRTHSQEIFIWKPHGPSCAVCIKSIDVNKGGRKPKRKYSHLNNPKNIWAKSISTCLIEAVPEHHKDLSGLSFADFDIASNPSLPLCKCLICENLMRRPVMIEGCQHGFCLGCMITMFEGKTSSLECPYCQHLFVPTQVVPCKVRWSLVNDLKLKCACGALFSSKNAYTTHRGSCDADTSHQMTINDLLKLDLQHTPISASVERATLRVLQHKINGSNDGTAEFTSGGPRVNKNNIKIIIIADRFVIVIKHKTTKVSYIDNYHKD